MQITLDTSTAGTDELTALIALLESLGGRLPDAGTHFVAHIESTPEQAAAALAALKATAGNDGLTVTNGADTPAASNGGTTTSDAPAASDVDSKGTPWDARIHSESKATVADGTWRKRRGVDEGTFERVMAELTAATSNDDAGENEAPPPPPADEPEGNDEQVPAPPAPTEETPSDPAPAASAPAAGDGQFPDFASFVAAVAKHGKTYAELNEMAGVVGVAAFKDLKDHADLWDTFFSMIG